MEYQVGENVGESLSLAGWKPNGVLVKSGGISITVTDAQTEGDSTKEKVVKASYIYFLHLKLQFNRGWRKSSRK